MLVTWNEFDRAFDRLWGRAFLPRRRNFGFPELSWPRVDVDEREDALVFSTDLPGLHPDDLSVTFENDVLTLSGERKELVPEGFKPLRRERKFDKFERRFRLSVPVDADQVEASFKDGVLTVTVPKAPEAKPLQIEVKS